MRCVVCEEPLPNVTDTGNQPSGGLEFVTYGHYGSAVFDPMNGDKIAVNICDPCIAEAIKRGNVFNYNAGK